MVPESFENYFIKAVSMLLLRETLAKDWLTLDSAVTTLSCNLPVSDTSETEFLILHLRNVRTCFDR